MKKKLTIAAFLFIGLFVMINWFNMPQYGLGNDEQWLKKRGKLAADIFSAAARFKLSEAKEQISYKQDWIRSPSLYAMINYEGVSPLLRQCGVPEIESTHALNIFMAGLALMALFWLVKNQIGPEAALFSVLFLAFFPRFVGNAHYNPKDIPAVALVTLSHVFVFRSLETTGVKNALLAGLFMGLAASAHLNSLLLTPVFFLSLINREKKIVLTRVLGYSVVVLGVLFFAWPLLWIDPLAFWHSIQYFSGPFVHHHLLYFGEEYQRFNVPWHYIPFYIFATTPLLTLVFFFSGLIVSLKSRSEKNRILVHLLLLSWLLLPILVRMNDSVVKYNGIRHVFISIPVLAIYAGWGLWRFWPRRLALRLAAGAVLAAYVGWQFVPIHPYEGDYFNEAFRWKVKKDIGASFEFPTWATPYRQAVRWLEANASPDARINIPQNLNVIQEYGTSFNFQSGLPADYTVVLGSDWQTNQAYRDKAPLYEIRRYNSRMVAVYKEPA